MWRWWFAIVAGCGYNPSRVAIDDPNPDGPDVLVDVPEGCFSTLLVICPVTPPSQPHDFGLPTTIDTDQSPLCIATDPDVGACVVAGTTITVSNVLRAVGSKPLVLLATESIDITGTVDVASRRGQQAGAGANPPSCSAGTAPTNGTTIAFGGGHGGTLGGLGGLGGPGDPDGAGGIPAAIAAFTFHGGCRGAAGGNSQGQGGSGGGVALIASGITISGTIHASGAGGDGTNIEGAGGSGGGSGGTIVLDATTIEVRTTGLLLAHGGGGGEGSGANLSDAGDDPTSVAAAAGGSGASDGGDGGAGATTGGGVNGNPPSIAPAGPSGGGGGGGGCGVIRATGTPTLTGTASPPPS